MNRFFYSVLLYIVLPFVPLKLWWRGIKQPEYRANWAERFGFYHITCSKPIIWLHCVSVGETRAAAPLIKALQLQYPQYQILLTHGTPTGREASEQLFADTVMRVYLPYDLPFAVNGFLKHFKPSIGLLLETELWFNLIAACKQQKIPLLLINARLSERSAHGYTKLGTLVVQGVQSLSAIAAQTSDDAARLQTLGAQNLSVTGNLKFDVKPPVDAVDKGLQLRKLLGDKRIIFLAASTRDGEEELILDAVRGLDLLTIIVPRHPQRFSEVEALIKSHGLRYVRRSNLTTPIASVPIAMHMQIILGDSMGELFSYYAACDFTFIGGSLLNYGGQNLIEPAAMGKPILIGQYTYNFADVANSAVKAGAAIRVNNAAELRQNIEYLAKNSQKRSEMQQAALIFNGASTGATKRVMQLIAQYLH